MLWRNSKTAWREFIRSKHFHPFLIERCFCVLFTCVHHSNSVRFTRRPSHITLLIWCEYNDRHIFFVCMRYVLICVHIVMLGKLVYLAYCGEKQIETEVTYALTIPVPQYSTVYVEWNEPKRFYVFLKMQICWTIECYYILTKHYSIHLNCFYVMEILDSFLWTKAIPVQLPFSPSSISWRENFNRHRNLRKSWRYKKSLKWKFSIAWPPPHCKYIGIFIQKDSLTPNIEQIRKRTLSSVYLIEEYASNMSNALYSASQHIIRTRKRTISLSTKDRLKILTKSAYHRSTW